MKKSILLLSTLISSSTYAQSCLDQAGPLVTVSGAQSAYYFKLSLGAATKVDARNASWTSQINIPVKIGGGDGICYSGGSIKGTWDPFTTSWDTYHNTYAFVMYGNNMTLENLRVDNYGDAVNVRNDLNTGNNFTAKGLHVTNNHDDCFQNDSMKSGKIVDSLFDGCYNFYSSRGYGSAPTNVVRVENNLVRLQGFPTYYGGQVTNVNDPSQYRHGGFWKIDEFDKAPRLEIHNNIFRADADSRSWIHLMPEMSIVKSCSNNIIVWLGTGPFPEQVPSCFKIVTDKSIWDNAVADWKYRHGQGPAPTTPTTPTTPTEPTTPPASTNDTQKPLVAITSPAASSFVAKGSVITISGIASDNVGVVKVSFFNNGNLICTDTTAPYSCNWKVPMKSRFALYAKAHDKAGNVGRSVDVVVYGK